ncbi:hypothetical protein S40288_03948 [Stachybotrys chartarum IBT 40288]|nr:hypothetical protein S40288_03948 [Stachybotrys chartarum IBT 40288]
MGAIVSLVRDASRTISTAWAVLSTLNEQYQRALERLRRAPGLPRPNPTSSYWQDDAPFPDLVDHQDALPAEVDVVIVGSGITAAAAATTLLALSPETSVAVLEARQLCSGATGRNGGHIKCVPYEVYPTLRKKGFGEEAAVRLTRTQTRHVEALMQVGRKFPLGEVRKVETVDLYLEDKDFEEALKELEETKQAIPELDYAVWHGPEARKHFGVNEKIKGAVSYQAGALWPYRLVTSLWHHLMTTHAPNLTLSTHTPVTSVSRGGDDKNDKDGRYLVQTPRGNLRARHVLHATNGFAPQLVPSLVGVVGGSHAEMTAQRPGDDFPRCHGQRSWSVIYRPGFDYITQRPDGPGGEMGDLMVGGGFFRSKEQGMDVLGVYDDSYTDAFPVMHLYGCMPTVFQPNWGAGSAMKKSWSGIVALTGDTLPLVGRLPSSDPAAPSRQPATASSLKAGSGEWVSAGYNGEGMVWAWLCGSAVAVMMAGEEDNDVAPGLGRPGGRLTEWFPVEELAVNAARLKRADLKNLADVLT